MKNCAVFMDGFGMPAKAIAFSFSIVQFYRSPDLLQTRLPQWLIRVKRGVPLCEIQNRKIERPVSSRIRRGRNPFLILECALQEAVAGGAVWHNISFGDDARSSHPQRSKNSFLQKLAVEFSGDLAN